ncbi:hypothetical protein [Sporomusa sp. KB1]|jgi:hypothetical protein|uniref:hypothetical protein n=1 Tax=Sporomusa sp. KB1 TaxID=943346 RepID=UPI0011A58AA5|nr:hypothetical protein [Sporomusa sp. KB1]TWH47722.1 hypothetical protein Salpa_3799 [Sporomusa sp. KB1]
MTDVTCSDLECRLCKAGRCIADAIGVTSDRFCVTGRRKPRDETPELMQQFKSGCKATQRGYKADHVNVIK